MNASRFRDIVCCHLLAALLVIGLAGPVHSQGLGPIQKPGTLYLATPALPDTVPVQQPDWDYFAWNSFIAMNWPALEAVPNHYRGVPNTSGLPGTTFVNAPNDALTVWESFKEKREVFNHPMTAGTLTWYSPVDYGTPRLASGVSVKTTHRTFHQNTGTSQSPDGLDETIEVQSQALEPMLPDGTTNPLLTAIPPVVTPRVWKGQPTKHNPIVYEVKVNFDYFNYVVANGLNVNNSQTPNPVSTAAGNATIHLPWRTSSATPPSGAKQRSSTINYRASDALAKYKAINASKTPPTNANTPTAGSVQLKAAWIKLGGSGAKASDFPTWHTALAQNYKDIDGKPVPSEPTLFGLVGLHIIQRIHQTTASSNAQSPGGTFIFATWEHASIFNSPVQGQPDPPPPTYFYSNYFAGQAVMGPPLKGFYPALEKPAYPVVRQYPVLDNTKAVTAAVHSAIRSLNPNSVWLNYHLVGTQFQAIDLSNLPPPSTTTLFPKSPNDPTGIGQPVFLANLGLETNLGLRLFQGQPPQITVIANYPALKSNAGITFARNNANTAFGGAGYNMGGCMGCHGVAQSKGYGFSFVLLDGYLGAATDTQDHFDQPGANPK